MLKSKIHKAVVTEAQVDYIGSITIDRILMDKVDLWPGEKVLVVNNTNGRRVETYVLEGKKNTKIICMNGGAARLFSPGDNITILAFAITDKKIKPRKILVSKNKFVRFL